MAKMSLTSIVGVVISLLILGILLPIGLNEILGFQSTDSTVQTLIATVLPILAVIGVIMIFIPKDSKN